MIGIDRAGRNVTCNNGFDLANGFQRLALTDPIGFSVCSLATGAMRSIEPVISGFPRAQLRT